MFYGNFDDAEDVFNSFNVRESDREGVVFLYAMYDNGGYDGSADAVFVKDGKFYTVSGSHCSCYGLEDQWDPEEMPVKALKHMLDKGYYGERNPELRKLMDNLESCGILNDPEKLQFHLMLLM